MLLGAALYALFEWLNIFTNVVITFSLPTSKYFNNFLCSYYYWDFPDGSVVKNLPSIAGKVGSIPGQGTKMPYAVEQLSPHAN